MVQRFNEWRHLPGFASIMIWPFVAPLRVAAIPFASHAGDARDNVSRVVASLDEALRGGVRCVRELEERVELLLVRDLADCEYIIDYWGRTGVVIDLRVAPMMQRLKSSRES